jgi:hypothetical protein
MTSDTGEKKSPSAMTDLARKILLTGLGAIFMTEESVRKTLSEMKIPKDAMGGLLDVVRRQKDDMLGLMAQELSRFFSRVKVHEEIQKALKGMEVSLEAKVSFDKKKNSSSTKISVRSPGNK